MQNFNAGFSFSPSFLSMALYSVNHNVYNKSYVSVECQWYIKLVEILVWKSNVRLSMEKRSIQTVSSKTWNRTRRNLLRNLCRFSLQNDKRQWTRVPDWVGNVQCDMLRWWHLSPRYINRCNPEENMSTEDCIQFAESLDTHLRLLCSENETEELPNQRSFWGRWSPHWYQTTEDWQ